MADNLTIEVDARAVLAMLDHLGEGASRHLKAAARETAGRIQTEARARLARQTKGTGQTAEHIEVEDIRGGYRVGVSPMGSRPENLPWWLEQGTVKMTARPFMFAAARLEEGPHMRRVREALDDAIAEARRG